MGLLVIGLLVWGLGATQPEIHQCPRTVLYQMIAASLGGGSLLSNGAMCCPGWESVDENCVRAVCWPACQNGGTCVSPGVCECGPGFTGSHCQKVFCRTTCVNGGTCIPPFVCVCPPGYTGLHCERALCSPKCSAPRVCTAPGRCTCERGWIGASCNTDINECLLNNGGCAQACVNTPGSYVCVCGDGYTLGDDGHTCKAVCDPDCWNYGVCTFPNTCVCLPWFITERCRTVGSIFNGR